MKRRNAAIGLIMLALPLSASASVYDTIHSNVRQQKALRHAEPIVRHFAAAIFRDAWNLRVSDIDQVLQADWSEVCSPQCYDENAVIKSCPPDDQSNLVREGFSDAQCEEMTYQVQALVRDEEAIRATARTLQLIATGQEEAIRETGGNPDALFTIIQAIMNIWKAGGSEDDDEEPDPSKAHVRFVEATSVVDEGALRDALAEVQNALASLPISIPADARAQDAADLLFWFGEADDLEGGWDEDPPNLTIDEQLTDAVWRYQYGARLVTGERLPTYLPPEPVGEELSLERQYVYWHWPQLESALINLWSLFPSDSGDGSVASDPNEITSYIMPPNPLPLFPSVTVWVRTDLNPLHTEGDAGLGWILPTEPVMPSLLSDDYLECIRGCGAGDECSMNCAASTNGAIPGGIYPPEPKGDDPDDDIADALGDGRGLCSQPFARRGYLCKVVEEDNKNDCLVEVPPSPDAIVLAECPVESRDGVTIAGGDPCGDLQNWGEEVAAGDRSDEWEYDPEAGFDPDEERYAKLWYKIAGLNEDGEDDDLGRNIGADGSTRPTFEAPARLCAIGQQYAYANSIGNNLCYAAACVEESFEWHSISWLRTPFTMGDKAYSFPIPQVQPAGSLTMMPVVPISPGAFPLPPYTPGRLALLLEADLCQSNGLPPLNPPSRCLFDTRRALNAGPQDGLGTAVGFINQPNQLVRDAPENLVLPTGVRIGAQLYADYLEDLSRPLTKLLQSLVVLLKQVTLFTLPSDMCPLGPQ